MSTGSEDPPVSSDTKYRRKLGGAEVPSRSFFTDTNPGYWVGTAGVLVPDSVRTVKCLDDHNNINREGRHTEMCVVRCLSDDPEEWDNDHLKSLYLTPDEYRTKYAELRDDDGKWYYKMESENKS